MNALNGNRHPTHPRRSRGNEALTKSDSTVNLAGPVPSPGDFPSLPRQARNLAAAATRAIGAAISRRPLLVPPDISLHRETICAACEENLSGRCRKCGCGVRAQFLRKTHLATERCPLNPPKWDAWSPHA
jgi:hypothetical protein